MPPPTQQTDGGREIDRLGQEFSGVTHLALASAQARRACAAASRPVASARTRVSTIACRSASLGATRRLGSCSIRWITAGALSVQARQPISVSAGMQRTFSSVPLAALTSTVKVVRQAHGSKRSTSSSLP